MFNSAHLNVSRLLCQHIISYIFHAIMIGIQKERHNEFINGVVQD
ncbi:hypothetical protein VPHK406_0049 [Vibrio phage K406]